MINEDFYKYGIKPSAIRELFQYGIKRKQEIGQDKVFDFSIGNPNVPPPDTFNEKLQEIIKMDAVELHSYSVGPGLPEVREKIANYIVKHYNFSAKPKDIFMTSGAAGALAAIIGSVTTPGDDVILVAPFFPEYVVWVLNSLCNVIIADADYKTFQLDIEAIENSITDKTAAIIINSPCNPSGVIYTEECIKALSDVLNKAQQKFNHDIYIISDEPYRKISYGNDVPWIPNFYDNTIVCDSASKSLSLPGERIGHIFVSPKAKQSDKIIPTIAGCARALGHVCAPVLFQRLYAECLEVDTDLSVYSHNRNILTKLFDELKIEYVKPQGAFYLWLKSPIPDAQKFSDFAKKYEILLVPSESFGATGWLRLGYCVSTETVKNSILSFKKMMKDLKEGK